MPRAWDEAMGGVPEDVPVRLLTVRGRPGRVLRDLADLLVVGATP